MTLDATSTHDPVALADAVSFLVDVLYFNEDDFRASAASMGIAPEAIDKSVRGIRKAQAALAENWDEFVAMAKANEDEFKIEGASAQAAAQVEGGD